MVSAYLSIKFNASFKNVSRNVDDAIKFGIAIYHGMYPSLRAAQIESGNDRDWEPVEAVLRSRNHLKMLDDLDYVYEVIR